MLPSYLKCNECREEFLFPKKLKRYNVYYLGGNPEPEHIGDSETLMMPIEAIWCFTCECLSFREDLPSLSELETAYAAVRAGVQIEYPFYSGNQDVANDLAHLDSLLYISQYRHQHNLPNHCLGCYQTNYATLEESNCLRHEPCEYGVLQPAYRFFGGSNGLAATPHIYDMNGIYLGKMTQTSWGPTEPFIPRRIESADNLPE